jgi:putative flippase GtrA
MIAIWYILFAVISTIVNLGFQYISFYLYEGLMALYVAMFIGTLAGLVVKYILDKKYIFFHTPKNKKDDGKKFILYSLMGVFTTFIFWGFEVGFDHFFGAEEAKYIGALIGLSIGYVIKYFLDKKFVFKESHAAQ